MMEFQQFNAIWDKKMEEFEMNAKQLTENMRKKHANELFRFKDKLQKSMVRASWLPVAPPTRLLSNLPSLLGSLTGQSSPRSCSTRGRSRRPSPR